MGKNLIKEPVKLLVGHMNPDLDVIGAMWLFLRFGGRNFEMTQFYFVPAGDEIDEETLAAKGLVRDEVAHVDTGHGPFDHHQPGNKGKDSATERVYRYLIKEFIELEKDVALERVVAFINKTDHFASYFWDDPTSDRYMFMLEEILAGLRSGKHFNDRELVEFGMICLDGAYTGMKIKVSAEEDLRELGREFETPWGKGLAIENKNDAVIKLAQKMGYEVVVRKDAEQGHVRIKATPKDEIDLRPVYERVVERDEEGRWYYHPSGHMVLNSSKKDPTYKPTSLSLDEVVGIIEVILKPEE